MRLWLKASRSMDILSRIPKYKVIAQVEKDMSLRYHSLRTYMFFAIHIKNGFLLQGDPSEASCDARITCNMSKDHHLSSGSRICRWRK